MREDSFISVDIETTGLSPVKDKIIEIGALKVVEGKVIEKFDILIDPRVELPERIVELTGISQDMLTGRPTIEEVLPKFLEFAKDLPLLGHNIVFDYSFLKTAAAKQKLVFERKGIDTLQIARTLLSDLESKSLEALCQYYGIVNKKHHRAFEDAKATMMLYEKLSSHENATSELLKSKPLVYRVKKVEPATLRQKKLLKDLIKYHKIEIRQSIDTMTKSEASRLMDQIFSTYGRLPS